MSFEEMFFRLYRQGRANGVQATGTTVNLPAETRRIAVINQKGGCGKTTTAVNLSACLAELGCRVLLVDLDPQGHATLALGLRGDDLQQSIYDALKPNGVPLAQILQATYHPNLKIVPTNSRLASLQVELIDQPARERVLSTRLDEVAAWFNFILIDCPPSLNILSLNALTAATHVIIPIQTHFLSLDGMRELFKTIQVVRAEYNPKLEILGILPTLFDQRTRLNRAMLSTIREYFKGQVFDTVIHYSSPLSECSMMGLPVTRYAPQTRGADDYRRLAGELLNSPHAAAGS